MDHLTVFVLYIILFRMAIIAAGITSIVLGYRLFIRGVFSKTNATTDRQDVEANIAGAKFAVRNAAPGTCFAAFGAIIIAVMFATGGPEVTYELLEKGSMKATFRGEGIGASQSDSKRALDYLERGDKNKAREIAIETLPILAPVLNDFAWVMLKTLPESLQTVYLAEAAVAITPKNPNFLHTLAEIQYQKGQKKEALQTLAKAQAIDPSFSEQLNEWRSKTSQD